MTAIQGSAMSLAEYNQRVNSFINDARWKDGVSWGDKQRPKSSSYDSEGCCAYTADFAKEVYGINNPRGGTAYYNSSEISTGDIIHVKNSNPFGHWFIVLERNGNQIYSAEGNYSGKVKVTTSHYWISNGILYNQLEEGTFQAQIDVGYHFDITGSSEYGSPIDIGTGFIAYIRNPAVNRFLTNQVPNIAGELFTGDKNQVWKFDRQSDGSYVITSAVDNYVSCMDVLGASTSGGANIYAYNGGYEGLSNQSFYLYNAYDATYIQPKHAPGCMVDMDQNSPYNVASWGKGQDWAPQEFWILKIAAPTQNDLSISSTENTLDSTIRFTSTYNNTAVRFVFKIYKDGNIVKEIDSKHSIVDVSASDLGPGNFSAYCMAENIAGHCDSNHVSFTVKSTDNQAPVIHKAEIVELSNEKIVIDIDVSDNVGVTGWDYSLNDIMENQIIGIIRKLDSSNHMISDTKARITLSSDYVKSLWGIDHKISLKARDASGNWSAEYTLQFRYEHYYEKNMKVGETVTVKELIKDDEYQPGVDNASATSWVLTDGSDILQLSSDRTFYTAKKKGTFLIYGKRKSNGYTAATLVTVNDGSSTNPTTPTTIPSTASTTTPTTTPSSTSTTSSTTPSAASSTKPSTTPAQTKPTTASSTQIAVTPETEVNEAAAPSASVQEKTIMAQKNDNDLKGSTFGSLQAKAVKVTKSSIRVQWKKIKGATKYVVYGNKCGKSNHYKKLKTVKTTFYTQKKLKKGTYYKYLVVAIKGSKAIATSKTIHAATTGGKVGNNKSVKVNKKTFKIGVGKTVTFKATAVAASTKMKVKKHRAIAFESSNKNIATVSKKGIIKGVQKGTCYVYAYAQNGVMAKVKVVVS